MRGEIVDALYENRGPSYQFFEDSIYLYWIGLDWVGLDWLPVIHKMIEVTSSSSF